MRQWITKLAARYEEPLRATARHLRWRLLWRQRRRMQQNLVMPMPLERTHWYKEGIDPYHAGGMYACQRLRNKYFIPYVDAGFKVQPGDSIYAIGSCFARGIELALAQRGFDVVSAARDFDSFKRKANERTPLGFTNKYTTFSILQELSWAFDPAKPFPEASLIEMDGGICIDPHINPSLKPVDRARTLERHRIMTHVMRRISDCRVVFITLGLVEVWYDKQVGVYLNITPTAEMRERHPGRYEFAATGYPENLANLERVHELLARFGRPDLKIVVTVSPIPLQATYTGQDIVLANTYSKSTLRAAAQDWAAKHPNVQYFPSYEIVMNSDKRIAWARDFRHVTGRIAAVAVDSFVSAFTTAP